MNYDVFISYSRKDSLIVDEICRMLKLNGISYFIDRRDIAGGMEFPEEIALAINESNILMYIAGRNSYSSKFTRNEILYALRSKGPQQVLCYNIDGSELPLMYRIQLQHSELLRMENCPVYPDLIDIIRARVGKKAISHAADSVDFNDSLPVKILTHSDWALNCGFSNDGKMLYSCGYEGNIKIFDILGDSEICTFSSPEVSSVRSAVFSPDSSTLFSVHQKNKTEGFIAKWSIAEKRLLDFKAISSDLCYNIILSADGKYIILAYENIAIIDAVSLGIIDNIHLQEYADEIYANPYSKPLIYGVGLVDNGRSVIIGGDGLAVTKLSLQGHECRKLLPNYILEAIAVCSPAQKFAISTSDEIMIYDYQNQLRSTRKFISKEEFFESITFNNDGSLLAAGDKKSNVYAWDTRSGRIKLSCLIPDAGRILSVSISPDNRFIAVSTESGGTYLFKGTQRKI